LATNLGGDTVRGEHDGCTFGHVGKLFHKDRALGLKVAYDVKVVDNLATHVDGRAELLERAIDTRAERSR
jgi:hypothetical protein